MVELVGGGIHAGGGDRYAAESCGLCVCVYVCEGTEWEWLGDCTSTIPLVWNF